MSGIFSVLRKYPESIGILLILLATAWQVIIVDELDKLSTLQGRYETDKNLHLMFDQIGLTQHLISPDTISFRETDFRDAAGQWIFPEERDDAALKQLDATALIRLLIYTVGTFLVLWGRIRDEKRKWSLTASAA